MNLDDTLRSLRDVYVTYPNMFQEVDLTRRLSTAFTHQVINQSVQLTTKSCKEGDGSVVDPLSFSHTKFIDIMCEHFLPSINTSLSCTMSSSHKEEVLHHFEEIWSALSHRNSPSDGSYITITKVRFLCNMLQSYFPSDRDTVSDENEFIHSSTKNLLDFMTLYEVDKGAV